MFKELNDIINSEFYRTNKYKYSFSSQVNIEFCNLLNDYPSIVKSIQLPDFTTSPIESYSSNVWHIAAGKEDIYQIQMTLYNVKSINNHDIDIYTKILKQWKMQKVKYPVEINFDLTVKPLSKINVTNAEIKFYRCEIGSVSGLTLDSMNAADIGEFSITIKSPQVSISF